MLNRLRSSITQAPVEDADWPSEYQPSTAPQRPIRDRNVRAAVSPDRIPKRKFLHSGFKMLGLLVYGAACGTSPTGIAYPNPACSCAIQAIPVTLTPVPSEASVEAIAQGTSGRVLASCSSSNDCQNLDLHGLSPGTYSIIVNAQGYNNATISATFSPEPVSAGGCQCGFVVGGPLDISLIPT